MRKLSNSWTITLGTIRSVPVRLHLSFFLLLAWVALGSDSKEDIITDILFITLVFFCVTLHECGHVFTAKFFGIDTRDITLYPFGGVATVLKEAKPFQEILIALAGPLVNVVICFALFPFSGISLSALHLDKELTFIGQLFGTNVMLAVFNLIPALPMDGGRVLRATLALFKVSSATTIAARVSQGISVCMVIYGFYINAPMLVIIGALIFSGAIQEMVHAKAKTVIIGRTVGSLLWEVEKLYVFKHGMTLSQALSLALRTKQDLFPVLLHQQLIGIVYREQLFEASAKPDAEQYVSNFMDREFPSLEPSLPIDKALEQAAEKKYDVFPVIENSVFLGFFYPQHVSELLLVDNLRAHGKKISEFEENEGL